jgi:hypothetical protein
VGFASPPRDGFAHCSKPGAHCRDMFLVVHALLTTHLLCISLHQTLCLAPYSPNCLEFCFSERKGRGRRKPGPENVAPGGWLMM